MRYLMALLVPLILLAFYNARADGEGAPSSRNGTPGRYEMERTQDGYVRLDTQTGAISLCHRKNSGWACEAVPDDRLALEEEIERLDRENSKLREQVAELANDDADDSSDGFAIELPSKEQILKGVDQAGEIFDDMMDRFQALVQAMKKQIEERT